MRGEVDVAVTREAPRGGKRAFDSVSVSAVLFYEEALAESLAVGGGRWALSPEGPWAA